MKPGEHTSKTHRNTHPLTVFRPMFSLLVNSLKGCVGWRAAPVTSIVK